ncbi:uroporphyrinogen-III synthase [bacterium BMS3Abin14]|nr:uroporphyrinogen-III synthase [bacterium BMS3Abin14]
MAAGRSLRKFTPENYPEAPEMSAISKGMLKGVGVLVTRSKDQAEEMVEKMEDMGAIVYHIPAITILPVPVPTGLREAISRILTYDAVIFTSTNGVEIFYDHLTDAGISPYDIPGAVCVGPKTAAAWEEVGGRTEKIPERFSGSEIADLLGPDLTGKSYLILRPEVVRSELGAMLVEAGAVIDEVVLYRTVSNRDGGPRLRALVDRHAVGVMTFTSPSSVHGIVSLLHGIKSIRAILCLCIGPTTAAAARAAGFVNVHYPDDYTVEGMLEMLPCVYSEGTKGGS